MRRDTVDQNVDPCMSTSGWGVGVLPMDIFVSLARTLCLRCCLGFDRANSSSIPVGNDAQVAHEALMQRYSKPVRPDVCRLNLLYPIRRHCIPFATCILKCQGAGLRPQSARPPAITSSSHRPRKSFAARYSIVLELRRRSFRLLPTSSTVAQRGNIERLTRGIPSGNVSACGNMS